MDKLVCAMMFGLLLGCEAGAVTLQATIPPPTGYERIAVVAESFGASVRSLKVLPDSVPVRFADGRICQMWPAGTRVVDMPFLFRVDLEQCTDMALRLYAEYHWARGSADSLEFKLQNGQRIAWREWRAGRRLRFDSAANRHVTAPSTTDSTRAEFERFLHYLFLWTGSAALQRDLPEVRADDLRPGDLIVQNTTGAMGHVSVILDVAQGSGGQRLYLIGNGWTPAQSFFVRMARSDEGIDGWFTLAGYEKHLSVYGFGPFNFRRWRE